MKKGSGLKRFITAEQNYTITEQVWWGRHINCLPIQTRLHMVSWIGLPWEAWTLNEFAPLRQANKYSLSWCHWQIMGFKVSLLITTLRIVLETLLGICVGSLPVIYIKISDTYVTPNVEAKLNTSFERDLSDNTRCSRRRIWVIVQVIMGNCRLDPFDCLVINKIVAGWYWDQ